MTATFRELQDDDDAEDAVFADAAPDGDVDDPDADLAAGENEWSLEQHHRLLLRMLLDAIAGHVESGDFTPSPYLEHAMEAAKHELWN